MCTAVTYNTKSHYFGRNLDLEYSYYETVTITPRNYEFHFRKMGALKAHYAMIGMAYVADGYPLYYDATNEKGVSMAGLNFPNNAVYQPEKEGADNIAPFEFIPWILGQCDGMGQVKKLLGRINLLQMGYSEKLPLAYLHWIIADKHSSITVEATEDGLKIYDNPVGVLTNDPPFDYQMTHLNSYLNLTKEIPESRFAEGIPLKAYCKGMGAIGLPGDPSSESRFVRAAFVKMNSVSGDREGESISQFFHILGSVEQQRGCVHLGKGEYEITVYASCCNVDKGIYYYITYDNRQITGVDMHREDLDGEKLVSYPLVKVQHVFMQQEEGKEDGR